VPRPVSGSDSASAPTRERSSSRSIAAAACAASSESMSATASGIASTAWRQIRISTPAICSPRKDGLEQGGARAGRLDQRLRERRVRRASATK
jgi:hypothetical protein